MPRIPVNFSQVDIDNFIRRGQSGSTDAIFARFMEENAIFTFPLHPPGLMWRTGSMVHGNFVGGAGANSIVGDLVAGRAVRYFQAISAFHNDPIARDMTIEIIEAGVLIVAIRELLAVPQNQHVAVERPIVVGPNSRIRARVDTIAGGSTVTLRTYSIQQGLAGTLPGL